MAWTGDREMFVDSLIGFPIVIVHALRDAQTDTQPTKPAQSAVVALAHAH